MWRVIPLVLLALVIPPFAVLAQDEPLPPRQYGRALPIDAIHTKLDIAVGVHDETVDGTAYLTVAPIGRDLSTISFDAKNLEVSSVAVDGGRSLDYENTG